LALEGWIIGVLVGLGFALVLGGFNRTFDEHGSGLTRSTLAEALLVYCFGLGLVGAVVGAVRVYRVFIGAALGWVVYIGYALARLPESNDDRAQWLLSWTNFGLLGGGLLGGLLVVVFLFRDEDERTTSRPSTSPPQPPLRSGEGAEG
jgi:hypothetical protein